MRALLAAFAILFSVAADAAELPPQFLGTWQIALVSGNTCRAADVTDAIEGHMIVKPVEVDSYEQTCRIVSIKMLRPSQGERADAEVALACQGGNLRWSERAIWHTEVIDGKKALAVTSLGQSNFRDEGRRIKLPSQIMTSIYLRCE